MITINEIVRQYPPKLQKKEFYDPMFKEYLHHHMLRSLFSSRFSGKISFLGGTALRYFYNSKRFSEDLDFDCTNLTQDQFFEMTSKVHKDISALGFDVFIDDKSRYLELQAFRRVFVFPGLKYEMGLSQHREAKFFVKIEAESQGIEYQPDIKTLVGFGIVVPVKIVPLEILYSSKIAAALKRKKDRDFYDVANLIDFAYPDFGYLGKKCQILNAAQLKEALLKAAEEKKLATRKIFDCEHMLFDKNDISMISNFSQYIEAINFDKFDQLKK